MICNLICLTFIFLILCLLRNWICRSSHHRALQHSGFYRVFVAGAVQQSSPSQVCTESSNPGRCNSWSTRHAISSPLLCVLPGQTGGVQLWGITSHHPTNVCCNRSLASGQHRWELAPSSTSLLTHCVRKNKNPHSEMTFMLWPF